MNYGEVQEHNRLHRIIGVVEEGGSLVEIHEDHWKLDEPPSKGLIVEVCRDEVDGQQVYSAEPVKGEVKYFGWEDPDRFWFFSDGEGIPDDFDVVFNTQTFIEVIPGTWTTGSTDDEVKEGLKNKAERLYKANALINCTSRRVECREGRYVYWANAISGTPALLARRYPVATEEAEETSRQGWLERRKEVEKAADWTTNSDARLAKLGTYSFAGLLITFFVWALWTSL